jgi:hypothetical protein
LTGKAVAAMLNETGAPGVMYPKVGDVGDLLAGASISSR